MKIPESIRIAGAEYEVETVKDLNDGQRVLAGQIDYTACKIRLGETLEGDARHLTLWHEIVHGIVNNAQLELEDEERVVEAMARGIFQILSDNAPRLGLS